ncbi:DUF3801 domain-containing protein [Bifidobacterium pseudolongum]|uniref:DUF3801 domain-containing protein n=1 Tax=Bifidobacterium pseudolongum TaxID=1694 RepID=UPI0010207B17|nr:DUF3801 domain-containing protein [Bifidobacterium pseudolongum]RYQ65491.1 hypothetical protein PG2103B_1715 [Bifidobacterium pseudolongum subsp. globosum]
MAEEAVEAAAIEVGKQIISRGADIIVKLSGAVARAVCKALKDSGVKVTEKTMEKISEKINSGEMNVKRLYRIGNGNLQQMGIDEDCIGKVKDNLKAQGVSFAVEENRQGELFLYFQGKDFDHMSHVVSQTIEDLGLKEEERIAHDQEREGGATDVRDKAMESHADVSQSVPPSYPPEHEPTHTPQQSDPAITMNSPGENSPLSEDYVPTPEEVEYFEAAGFEANHPSEDLTHKGNEGVAIDVHSFRENQTDALDNDEEKTVEHNPEPKQDMERSAPQTPLAERLAVQNAGMDEPERTESASMGSTRYPSSDSSSMSADASDGQNDYGTDLDTQQQDNVLDTSTETRSKTVRGKKTKKSSIKQRLRTEISNRAKQKQLASKNHAALDHGAPKRANRSK